MCLENDIRKAQAERAQNEFWLLGLREVFGELYQNILKLYQRVNRVDIWVISLFDDNEIDFQLILEEVCCLRVLVV